MKSQRLNRYKGTASEHLACADIWMQGYKAYMIPSDIFDVIMKVENQLFRLQVKSSSHNQGNGHHGLTFGLTRGCKKKNLYNKRDIDGWVFVDLIYKKVCYMDILELNNQWKTTIQRDKFQKYTLERLLKKKGI